MKADETQRTTAESGNVKLMTCQHASGGYDKVFDQRKQRVRGLWERNGSFYAQLTIPHPVTALPVVRRVRLEDKDRLPVTTLPQAIAAMNKMKVQREDDSLKVAAKRTPTLVEYSKTYIERLQQLGSVKRPDTIALEGAMLKSLCGSLGGLRLREVSPLVVHNHMAARVKNGASARTVNIEVTALRNLLRSAIQDHLLNALPQFMRLKELTPKRRCLTSEEVERLARKALEFPRTGQMVHDFILLMAYSGGRWSETLRIRWQDVDFDQKQLHIGADGLSKNGESRSVDFNSKLEAHLRDMETRKVPDSAFLFPAPRRSEKESLHALSFNRTLRELRAKANVPDFTCHMCRHYFASMALMSKVDIHTVASWLGHRDNGVLLAKTYSHLLNEHKREQAQRVSF
jgi:integrase